MKAKASVIAQKLINLYRQSHVIVGGWATLNPIFLEEATPDVIREMRNLPTSKFLIKHIENLRNGVTPMDSIDPELLPYGGMMSDEINSIDLSNDELQEITSALDSFTPDQNGLETIHRLNVVKRFGDEWMTGIRAALTQHPDLVSKWDIVIQTERAYSLWNSATDIISRPITERVRAQVQADMPEYETYLPMFGDAGAELLSKLRTFLTSMHHDIDDSESSESSSVL